MDDLTRANIGNVKQPLDTRSRPPADGFLSALSDEFRNSLGSLRNAVQALRQLASHDEQILRVQGLLDRQTTQLGRLLDDLLDLSRLSRGRLGLHTEIIPLAELTGRATSLARPQIEARGLFLRLEHSGGMARLSADGPRLAHALANLIDEAGRRAPTRASVWFRSELHGDLALLSIAAPARLEPAALTDAFGRAGELRLQLARRLIEMHHGDFEGHLQDGGELEFLVRLPVRPTLEVPVAPPARPRIAATGEARARRILVIDDNVDAAESLALILSLDGHVVSTAHDGDHGVEMARANVPEVVFIDIGLPGIDGFEVARHIRRLPGMEHALLIAVTGFDRDEFRARSLAAGIDRHLLKPVDPAALQRLLASSAVS